jgi:hypothetical protein
MSECKYYKAVTMIIELINEDKKVFEGKLSRSTEQDWDLSEMLEGIGFIGEILKYEKASDLLPYLYHTLITMSAKPQLFKKTCYHANTYIEALRWIDRLYKACREYPKATIKLQSFADKIKGKKPITHDLIEKKLSAN